MDKIIVDTSIIIAVILNEKEKKNIISLTFDKELIAPKSLKWEIGNAFSAMFKKERIQLAEAKKAIHKFESIPIQYASIDLRNVLEVSHSAGIYAYDAYMLVCAMKYRLPLITLDKLLIEKANELNVKLLEVK